MVVSCFNVLMGLSESLLLTNYISSSNMRFEVSWLIQLQVMTL